MVIPERQAGESVAGISGSSSATPAPMEQTITVPHPEVIAGEPPALPAISPEMVRFIPAPPTTPVTSRGKGKTRRKVETAVMTATPYKKRLQEEEAQKQHVKKKQNKKERKERTLKRKVKKVEEFCDDNSSADGFEEYECTFCHSSESVPGEEWVQCCKCKDWAHEMCCDLQDGNSNLICDFFH